MLYRFGENLEIFIFANTTAQMFVHLSTLQNRYVKYCKEKLNVSLRLVNNPESQDKAAAATEVDTNNK